MIATCGRRGATFLVVAVSTRRSRFLYNAAMRDTFRDDLRFRLKAFALHISASAAALALVCGGLYLGWYRWPGWFLADVGAVVLVMVGVDLALGPLLTLVIANPRKKRTVLARDIGVIVIVQLAALTYAASTLWSGRPLYFAFSVDRIELVRASDIPAEESKLALAQNSPFVPHWYSRPQYVSAQLPDDPRVASKIMDAAVRGGLDVINMPRYFTTWEEGVPSLKKTLKRVDALTSIGRDDKKRLKERLIRDGFSADEPSTILVTGRGDALLAVIDPSTGRILGIP